MKDELVALAYKRWKIRQVLSGLPPLRIEKLTKLALRSDYCSWSSDEVVLHIQNSEEAFSLAESLSYLGTCSKILVRTLRPAFSIRLLELPEREFLHYRECNDMERERLATFYSLKALSLGYNALLLRLCSDQFLWPDPGLISFILELATRSRTYKVKFGLDVTCLSDSQSILHNSLITLPLDFFFHAQIERIFSDHLSLLPHEALLEGVARIRSIVKDNVTILAQASPDLIWSESSLIHLLSVFPDRVLLAFDAYLPIGSTKEHPIWILLQQDLLGGNLPIMPIFQAGSSSCGQGAWPTFSGLHWDPLIRLAKQLQFPAICAFSDYFPCGEGFLSCSLWCLGQSCWTEWPLFSLYSYWLRFHFPEWDLPLDWPQLINSLARSVMATVYSHKIEHKWILTSLQKIQEKRFEDIRLKTYLSSFVRDVQFLLNVNGSIEEKKIRLIEERQKILNCVSPFSMEALILAENGIRI
ncbi:hypothetical protein [Candidatus Similichlamydia epinepheli]|uniref:hypothetical protein n=1 Tax=Candidatus Similichlamydia epinepheli TaxID=1903953 RepID=UPI001300B70F|nr:hypothetical protein [Candidatus Similichlamydia epinepheli]